MAARINAEEIARLCLHDPKNFNIQLSQTKHRIQILSYFPIQPNARVLEIGCGQGDATAVLVELVGESGHVTAVDPADISYGAPFTLGQSQAHLSASRLGSRITFVQQDPIEFLSSKPEDIYDVAVLAHCIFYFSSPSVLLGVFEALAKRATYICVAEHSLVATKLTQVPHVLAVLSQASLEVQKAGSESNVRTVLSAHQVNSLAEEAGLHACNPLASFSPTSDLLDGKWEVMAVLAGEFEEEVKSVVSRERERASILAQREAVQLAVGVVGGVTGVETMDTYCAVYKGKGGGS